MDWKAYYKEHTMTAEEAVNKIKSGDRVVIEHACGEPIYLVDKMVENADAYKDVEIVHMVAMGKGAYCAPEMAEHFHHNSLFVGASTRKAVESGQGDFTPCFFFEIPRLFHSTLPVDVALINVTPPDEDGNVSMGVSCDYTAAKGTVSKIVPFLDHGAAVTTCRNDVDYVITEFGIAHLKGETLRNRAKNLIKITHPDFRAGLIEEFEKRFHCAYEA